MAAGDVQGLREAKAAFSRLPEVARARLGDATRVTASEIVRNAIPNVPVRYGFLKRHLASKFNARTGVAKAGVTSGVERDPKTGKAVNPAKYAKFAEFGTVHHAAQPFMLPAAEGQADPYLSRCKAAGKMIERDLSTSARTI
jgi:HK97 gp10 family phage protein